LLYEGKGIESVLPILGVLVIFAVILFPLGVAMFRMGIKKGEKIGSLAKWA
jgi:hypothetical protein